MPRLTFEQNNVRIPTSTINQARLTDDSGFQNLAQGINRLGKAEQELQNAIATNKQKTSAYSAQLAYGQDEAQMFQGLNSEFPDPSDRLIEGPKRQKALYAEHQQQAFENGYGQYFM